MRVLETAPQISPLRLRSFRIALVALALVSAYFSLHTLAIVWGWPSGEFGIEVDGAQGVVNYLDPSEESKGVRVGDRLDLAAMPFQERQKLYEPMLKRAGTKMTLRVSHAGRWRSATFVVPVHTFAADDVFFGWLDKIVAALFIATGVVVAWGRPDPMRCGLAVFLIGTHVFILGPLVAPIPDAVMIGADALVQTLCVPGLIVFAARFPDGRANRTTPYWDAAAAVLFTLYFGYFIYGYVPLFTARPLPGLPDVTIAFSIFYALVFIALCVKLRTRSRAERAGWGWIVAGYGVGIVGGIGIGNDLLDLMPQLPEWVSVGQIVLTLALPAAIAYAAIRYRTMALGYVENRALIHASLSVAVAATFLIGVWFSSRNLSSSLGVGCAMFAALLTGLAFQAQRRRIVRFVDRIFLPRRYEMGLALDRLRESARSSASATLLVREAAGALDLASLAVFVRAPDGGFVREAACGWPRGTAWHLLPDEPLTRAIAESETGIAPCGQDDHGIALPAADARPRLAVSVRRAGRVHRALLVSPVRGGADLGRDEIRSLQGVFEDAKLL